MTVVIMIKVNALCEPSVAHDNSSSSFDAGLKVSKFYEVLVPVAQTKVPPASTSLNERIFFLINIV